MKYFLAIIFLLFPFLVLAQGCDPTTSLCNPAGSEKVWTSSEIAAKVIKIVLGVVGIVSLVLFIYAGFLWMTAAGKSDVIKKAQGTFVWAVLGLIVVFSAYILVSFVLKEIPL